MLSTMKFAGQWRDYQQRALDEFNAHLEDRRVHVVAAPGSGKTVLGLELMRRLGRPAVVLAPTRTIRDQWVARLVPMFLHERPDSDLSASLEAPATMTTATYQALHAIWTEDARFEALTASLRQIGPVTLILDEAHHLRREWWLALQALIDALPDAHIVALTATPPYDAPFAERARYDAMCGPIDLEIGVPELVRNGDLCPHQDHIIFSSPDREAGELLEQRRLGIAEILAALRDDYGLIAAIEADPWLIDPDAHIDAILEAPEHLSAMLVHLAASGRPLPGRPLALLGVGPDEIPLPSPFWTEVLLNGLLFDRRDLHGVGDARVAALKANLHALGLIEGGRVRIVESRRLFTMMAGSLAKLDSIVVIARAEAASLGDELRMVVLCDYVRAGELPRSAGAGYQPAKLGVVPIFETLRRAGIAGQRLGVLTGTLVIVPRTAVAAVGAIATDLGIPGSVSLAELSGCPDHVQLIASAGAAGRIVELVTALFLCGDITILTGTQALLGEGWDAPAINSLILASNSAAYMLSNQMRGRAIRIDPARPDKVASIWHLATTDVLPTASAWAERLAWGHVDRGEAITSDLNLLERRFRAFEGIANGGSTAIENGVARLNPGGATVAEANARTLAIAADRRAIADRWRHSLGQAPAQAHVRQTASPQYAPRGLSWHDTVQWLGASAVSSGAIAGGHALRGIDGMATPGAVAIALGGAATLAAVPNLARAAWLLWRNGSVERSLGQVGMVVLNSLHHAGIVSDTELESGQIEIRTSIAGRHDVILHGVSRATERAAIDAIAEILSPVGNPRYLLVRRGWFGWRRTTDYHAVPTALARRKEWAEYFQRQWRANIGSSRLVFTRTQEGRIALLRARARSFAAGFQRGVERRSAWL